MVDDKINIEIIDRPILEIANTFYLYCNLEESIDKFNSLNFTVDKDVLYIINRIEEDLSLFVKSEIKELSKLNAINILMLAYTSDYKEINNIDDFFKVFNRESLEKLFDYIGGAFLSNFFPDLNEGWGKVKNSIPKMREYIENLEQIDKELKEKIIALYKYPEETKMRVSYIFHQFYEKGYKQFEDMIIKKEKEEADRYRELLNSDINKFIEINIQGADIENYSNRKISTYVSYMQQLGNCFLFNIDSNILDGYLSIGCRNIDFFNSKTLMEDFDKFLKTIADPTRFKIISLVSKKSWYAQALAKELAVTPATIHHHMDNLAVLGIVTSYKSNNKILYRLNSEIVKEYLEILKDKLIGN